MITLGLLGVLPIALLGLLFFLLTRFWSLEVAFVRVSGIPLAALLVQGLFFRPLLDALGYAAAVVLVLTCITSLFLTAIGATLVASDGRAPPRRKRLLRATLLASVPGALLAGVLLYALLARTLSSA